MSTIITVVKAKEARCDYKVTAIKNGRQLRIEEVSGCPGSAAAVALNFKSSYTASKIVGPEDVISLT